MGDHEASCIAMLKNLILLDLKMITCHSNKNLALYDLEQVTKHL